MSRKRPGFEIFPGDEPAGGESPADLPPVTPPVTPARPGPMAAAIAETAGSLGARADAEADIRAENDAIAHEHMRLVRLGLVAEPVPLAAIRTTKLTRDRSPGEDAELEELVDSIRALGLSNPIRLERAAEGAGEGAGEGFELIQGFRRLAAYRLLLAETGDEARWGAIPALVSEPGETLEMLYRRMIDENLMRRGVSFAELARLAIDYALDPASGVVNADQAVALLYRSASYQKRSHIRGFLPLMAELGDVLLHAGQIPRALGLEVSTALLEQPDLAPAIRAELAQARPRSAAEEMAILRRLAGEEERAAQRAAAPAGRGRRAGGAASARGGGGVPKGEGRSTALSGALRVDLSQDGMEARVTVTPGRIEILTGEDFSHCDEATLRDAIGLLLAQLG